MPSTACRPASVSPIERLARAPAPAGVPVHVAETREALAHRGEAGARGVRSGLPVSRRRARRPVRGCRPSGPPDRGPSFSIVPGRKFSISTSAFAASRRASSRPARILQVERHRLLVAREAIATRATCRRVEPRASRGSGRPPRWLDLDHFGAEVAEYAAGEGTGEQLAELQDAHAVERAGAGFVRHAQS